MSTNTKIQWCHHTHNPWRGCRKVAPECENCYITSTPPFRISGQTHGPARVRAGKGALAEPIKWNAAAEKAGERNRVFCLSLGDWLDDENVPIEWLAELLATIHQTPNLDWLLLTKRPQNWTARIEAARDWNIDQPQIDGALHDWIVEWFEEKPPSNVWIGVSAGADQTSALDIPAHIHFLSCEPMLHPMDTTHAVRFDWIIFGGESGPKSRQCEPSWIHDGVTWCRRHGIAAFVKQMGGNLSDDALNWFARESGVSMRDKKGGNPEEWPESFRVRQFPEVKL